MKQRRRIFESTLLGLAIAMVATPTAFAHPFLDSGTSSAAPQVRVQAYGSGAAASIDALRVRSVALNRQYGVGASVTSSGNSFNWTDGAVGAAGVFTAVFVLAGAVAITRRRTTPLGA